MVEKRTEELINTVNKLNETFRFTLRALVTALDTRDTDTQGHSLRVVKYTLKLAELTGLKDEKELKVLEYGALLHDIGKIGIPDAILRKPSQLTKEEWQIMETHPIIGYKILNKIKFLEEASQIVLHHHEKWNGSGYPDKLKGENIPVGSRIFSVADAMDAMTSMRPYRKALTFTHAINELRKNSGSQFDPDIVEAFFKLDLEYWKDERKLFDETFKDPDFF